MCGITGFITAKNIKAKVIIKKMTNTLHHRGPDDEGYFFEEKIGLAFGHKRLSIQDLSKHGHQPMQSQSKRFIIIYNGEIYNFKTLKKELNSNFTGHSDTEVLLSAIENWGLDKSLSKIIGMFAFALYDKKEQEIILARDRVGEKPLYYGWQNKSFLFASELKAIRQHPDFINDIDRNSIASLLRYNYIPSPYSIYKNINKLEPGHYLKLKYKNNNWQQEKYSYWSIDASYNLGQDNIISDEIEAKQQLKSLLKQSIAEKMIADVPLGVFLSGGVDSSLVAALAKSNSNEPIKTFTIGFKDKQYNEANYAKEIANHLNTKHTELYLNAKDCLDVIPKLANIYDEPFADSSQIPSFLVAKLAKTKVTVALSGDGGDEFFCGYNRYFYMPKVWHKIKKLSVFQKNILKKILTLLPANNWNILAKLFNQPNLGDKLHKLANVLNSSSYNDVYQNLLSQWQNPNDLVIGGSEYLANIEINNIEQMMLNDQKTYLTDDILTKTDRASMVHSLETRTPLLDHRIIELSYQISLGIHYKHKQSKYLLRQILYDLVPKQLIERPKMGFALPIEYWLRSELRDWAENLLQEEKLKDYFNPKPIISKWQQHLSTKNNWQYQLWGVLMFQMWLENN